MILRFAALLILLFFAAFDAKANDMVVDLAKDRVDITAGFTGADLVIYGSIPRTGDVAIMVKGPERTATVWRKGQFLGIWLNQSSMKFRNVPAYYDYALSNDENNIASAELLKTEGLGLNALKFSPDDDKAEKDLVSKYQEALIRLKQTEALFPLHAKNIEFLNDRFFKASFRMPPDLPTGIYHVHSFLIKNGKITDRGETSFKVAQVGIGARAYEFAYSHPVAYGGVCVLFAVLAGWLANMLYRRD